MYNFCHKAFYSVHLKITDKKYFMAENNETQAPHIWCFTLLVMLGDYEPTCILYHKNGNNVNHGKIMVEARKLIKIRNNLHNELWEFWNKSFYSWEEIIDRDPVPVNNSFWPDPLKCPFVLAGNASGCWLSALGASVPYNREKNGSLVH